MQKKERFEKPNMEKIMFEAEDVIVTSGGCSGDCVSICQNNCRDVCGHDCAIITLFN